MIADFAYGAVILSLCGLVVWAGLRDLVSMTIPNRVVLLVVGLFAAATLAGLVPPAEALANLITGALVLVCGFLLFACRVIGGGDAKLAAATALWLGPTATPGYLFYMAVFGAGLAATLIVFRRATLPASLQPHGWAQRLHAPTGDIPYGVAMALATLVVIAQTHLPAL